MRAYTKDRMAKMQLKAAAVDPQKNAELEAVQGMRAAQLEAVAIG